MANTAYISYGVINSTTDVPGAQMTFSYAVLTPANENVTVDTSGYVLTVNAGDSPQTIRDNIVQQVRSNESDPTIKVVVLT